MSKEPLPLQGLLFTPEGELLATPLRMLWLMEEEGNRHDSGVILRAGAVVYAGSPGYCARPAIFDLERVRKTTPEWRAIQEDGIRPGTARYVVLTQTMHRRIAATARKTARKLGCDLLVRAGDITDARGKQIVDLTEKMMRG